MAELPKDLTKEEFNDSISVILGNASEAYVLLAEVVGRGQIPVGVSLVKVDNNRAWPHLSWFPEASARSKIEIAANLTVFLRKRFLMMIVCRHEDKGFFNTLSRLGLTRRVGTLDGWFDEEPAALYQNRMVT